MNNFLNQLTSNIVMVLMVSAVNRSIGVPGASLSCSVSKNGGAFSGITPTIVDRGLGWYAVTLSPADCAVVGQLVLHVEASGCDHSDVIFDVVSRNRAAKLLA
jgi:hypothetical protein